jgi:hypothetical protein
VQQVASSRSTATTKAANRLLLLLLVMSLLTLEHTLHLCNVLHNQLAVIAAPELMTLVKQLQTAVLRSVSNSNAAYTSELQLRS